MDHLLVPDVQNIIIGLLDHITQQRLSLTKKAFKSLLPVHDPTVWEFKFPKKQKLVLPSFLRKGGCTVYWGDGTVDEYTVEKDAEKNVTLSHLFGKGIYKICIFANSDDTLFSSSEFKRTCRYMKSFVRLGKGLTDLSRFFNRAHYFNGSLNHLDTSKVTNMYEMFHSAVNFNQPLGNWNVSNVTNMTFMFYHADNFNQPLENWDVSNVTNMHGMFEFAGKFDQPLETWDVSNVIDTSQMFIFAYHFNQPLEKWNVSNVTNMSYMFYGAKNFKQQLESWNISDITDTSDMFESCHIIPSWY